MSFLLRISRYAASTAPRANSLLQNNNAAIRAFTTSRFMAAAVDSDFVSQITAVEKTITNSDEPAKGGPTAMAQKYTDQQLTSDVIHDITLGERKITGKEGPIQGGPTSVAQSMITGSSNTSASSTSASTGSNEHSGRLDSHTLSKITEKEKQLTGEDGPVKGGPTAMAQQHAGEPITSEALHDITEGEKKVTGGERVKGGPTSQAQSELGKSRS